MKPLFWYENLNIFSLCMQHCYGRHHMVLLDTMYVKPVVYIYFNT